MAYLYKSAPPDCGVRGCPFQGRYGVRGGVPLRRQFPRCRRHAEELCARLDFEEKRAEWAATVATTTGEEAGP